VSLMSLIERCIADRGRMGCFGAGGESSVLILFIFCPRIIKYFYLRFRIEAIQMSFVNQLSAGGRPIQLIV
jgi:hypothetical protein